jgi:hypothetical protein
LILVLYFSNAGFGSSIVHQRDHNHVIASTSINIGGIVDIDDDMRNSSIK